MDKNIYGDPFEIINPITLDSVYITNEDQERIDKFLKKENEREIEILSAECIF